MREQNPNVAETRVQHNNRTDDAAGRQYRSLILAVRKLGCDEELYCSKFRRGWPQGLPFTLPEMANYVHPLISITVTTFKF